MQRKVSTASRLEKSNCPGSVLVSPEGGRKFAGLAYPAPLLLWIAILCPSMIQTMLPTRNPSRQAVSLWFVLVLLPMRCFKCSDASKADQKRDSVCVDCCGGGGGGVGFDDDDKVIDKPPLDTENDDGVKEVPLVLIPLLSVVAQ